jgi:membrane protein implicated in regulation of membrane protease activity
MLLNAIGLLLILAGTGLLGFGAYAASLSAPAGGDVLWVVGLNSWQAALVGLACYAGAAALFSLARARRLSRVEARSDAAPGA